MQVKAFRKRRLDKKALQILGAFLGLTVLLCGGALYSLQAKRSEMEQRLAAKEANLQQVRTISASLPQLQRDYRMVQAELAHLEGSLPSDDYVPTLLGQVERTAKACGLKIAEFRPKPQSAAATEENPGAPTIYRFDLTVRGNYLQIQKLLVSLTRFRKILGLNGVNVRPEGETPKGKNPVLTGTLSFTAYVVSPQDKGSTPASTTASKQATASVAVQTAPRG